MKVYILWGYSNSIIGVYRTKEYATKVALSQGMRYPTIEEFTLDDE